MERINHLAVWVAAIVFFAFGALWYIMFSKAWTAYIAHPVPGPNAALYIGSFILGLILAYATAIALTRRPEDQTLQQGIGFAVFMGIAIYGTQTLSQALYEARPIGLWLIDAGYVLIGFAIMGAIIGAWEKRGAATE